MNDFFHSSSMPLVHYPNMKLDGRAPTKEQRQRAEAWRCWVERNNVEAQRLWDASSRAKGAG